MLLQRIAAVVGLEQLEHTVKTSVRRRRVGAPLDDAVGIKLQSLLRERRETMKRVADGRDSGSPSLVKECGRITKSGRRIVSACAVAGVRRSTDPGSGADACSDTTSRPVNTWTH